MKNFKRPFFYVLAAGIIVISLMYFGLAFSQPHMGVIISLENRTWQVSTIDANGAASQAGIKVGDVPVSINGRPAEDFLETYESVGTVYGQLVEEMVVSSTGGGEISVDTENLSLHSNLIIEIIGFLVISIMFLITGSYLLVKKPDNIAAELLFWCGPVIMLALSGTVAAEIAIPLSGFLSIAAISFGPWLLFHFFLVFPEERVDLRRSKLIYLIYLPALFIVALYPLIGYENGQALPAFRSIRLLMAGLGFIAIAIVAVLNYTRNASNKTRQQMKIILISCLAGVLPVILLSILPQALHQQPVIAPGFAMFFIVLIPLGISYAMITERLMKIDIVIRESVVQGTLTLIMAMVLGAILGLIMPLHRDLSLFQQIILYLLLGLIAAGIYGGLRSRIKKFVDKRLYKTRYDMRRTIDNLNKTMGTLTDYREISRVIIGTIVNTLETRGTCLFLKTRSGSHEVAASQGIFMQSEYQQFMIDQNFKKDPVHEFPNLATDVHPDLAFIMRLNAMGEEIGVIYISTKVSGEKFISDDLYLLQEIASGAAISLERTLLIRDVSLRDSFVSIASHELRTPLTAIMGYADLLNDRDPPEEVRRKWVEYILEGGKRLSTIVDDLLNVTRIQSGRTVFKLSQVELSPLIKSVVAGQSSTTENHKFSVRVDERLPKVLAERDKLTHILENLVNNAIKYSPEGGTITVSAKYIDKEKKVIISVADKGMGIAKEEQLSLFTTFHRIHRPETQGIPGSGLGLYIVKKWVEAMDGSVWLESEIDKGATFHVSLPSADGYRPERT